MGYIPATKAALTTAQFSELVLTSLISTPPLLLTKPEERRGQKHTCFKIYFSASQKGIWKKKSEISHKFVTIFPTANLNSTKKKPLYPS